MSHICSAQASTHSCRQEITVTVAPASFAAEGDYYRIASYMENQEYDCYEVVSKNRKEALITYVSVIGRANYHSRRIYVKGLLADGLYKIEGQEGVFHGDTLMRAGINAPGTWATTSPD